MISSFTGVFLKLASRHSFFSFNFVAFYAVALCFLVLYAVLWQIVLRKLRLSVAYANTGIKIVYGFTWAYLLFGEIITVNMLVGAGLIIAGILILVTKDARKL